MADSLLASPAVLATDPRLAAAFARFSKYSAVAVVALGVATLLGWALDVPLLGNGFLRETKANSGLAFVLAGVSLFLLQHGGQKHPYGRLVGGLCAAGVALMGLLTLSQYAFGWDLGIDQLLFEQETGANWPGRMAQLSAVNFLLLGTVLLLMREARPRSRDLAQLLSLAAFVLAFLPALGYGYEHGFDLAAADPAAAPGIAINTLFGFLALSLGLLSAHPDRGFMPRFASAGARGTIMRRVLPLVILVPVLLGGLRLAGQRAGYYDTEFGVALSVLATMVLLGAVIWGHSGSEEIRRLNKTLEQRVAARTAELESANRDLESFGYSVSHDLRAPLRAIDNFSAFLLEDHAAQLDAEGRRLLGVIRSNTARMGQLINEMLEFSRAGKVGLAAQTLDMDALVRQVFGELQAGAPRPVTFTPSGLPPAWGDRAMVRQVITNLLANAIKFSGRNAAPRVEMTGSSAGGETLYTVRDNGVGFDPRYAHKLFGIFQRLHSTDEFEGTGIGLAIVERIVGRHGGRVWADGSPGAGATFSFSLPQRPNIGAIGVMS